MSVNKKTRLRILKNEILKLFANSIIGETSSLIHKLPVLQYFLVVDGTQDIEENEQESIKDRYVDHDLIPHEAFLYFLLTLHWIIAAAASASISIFQAMCQTRWTTRYRSLLHCLEDKQIPQTLSNSLFLQGTVGMQKGEVWLHSPHCSDGHCGGGPSS